MPAQWIRKRLWERLEALFPPGARVLDVTAGTGLDAVHLVERGVHVIACDLSPDMLAQLRVKDPAVETRLADFNHLELETWDLQVDGVLSTFAGLNTSPDLRPFAAGAAQLLRPGGVLFIHLLNRWPMLDLLRHFARLRWREGWRLLANPRRDVKLGGVSLPHYLHSPLALYHEVFAPHFHLSRVEAQGLLRPVGAGWGARLDSWERALAPRAPFRSLGTFFALEMIRK